MQNKPLCIQTDRNSRTLPRSELPVNWDHSLEHAAGQGAHLVLSWSTKCYGKSWQFRPGVQPRDCAAPPQYGPPTSTIHLTQQGKSPMVNLTALKCTSLNCTITLGCVSLQKMPHKPSCTSFSSSSQLQDLMGRTLSKPVFIPALLSVFPSTSLSFSMEYKYCILVILLSCGKTLLEIKLL